MLQDAHVVQKMQHFNRERVLERVVHAKGSARARLFEVTADVTQWTNAAFLSKVGKRTPVGLAHHGLTDQAGLRVFTRKRCRRQRRIASVGPSGGPRETRVSGCPVPSAGHDAGRRTSVTRQADPHTPPSAARRSSQARSHRRHSSADRRQCSW